MRYSDHEQRQMDIKSGEELDRHAERKAREVVAPMDVGKAIAVLKLRGSDLIEYATLVAAVHAERSQDAASCFWLERLEHSVSEAQQALAALKARLTETATKNRN